MKVLDLFAGEDAPLMAVRKVGSTPTRSASACGGLGIHRLVATSDVAKRDPGHVAQLVERRADGLGGRGFESRRALDKEDNSAQVTSLLPSRSSRRTKPLVGRVPRGTMRMPPFLASLNWTSSRSNVFSHM